MFGLLSRAFLFLIVSFAAEGLYLNCWMSFGSRGHGLFAAEPFLIEGGVLFGAALGLFLEDLGDVDASVDFFGESSINLDGLMTDERELCSGG